MNAPHQAPEPAKPEEPARPARARLKRLVAFPLLLFYCAVLAMAAWPRQLMVGSLFDGPQLAANFVLAELGWPAGLSVFSGQDEREVATLRNCFRVAGVTASGEGKTLFDTMADCREGRRGALKDPLETYITRTLARGTRYLRTPGGHGDRNQYPLSELFALADYWCHKGGSFERVLITGRYQVRRIADGALGDVTIDEGVHHCAEGAWEPLGLRHQSR